MEYSGWGNTAGGNEDRLLALNKALSNYRNSQIDKTISQYGGDYAPTVNSMAGGSSSGNMNIGAMPTLGAGGTYTKPADYVAPVYDESRVNDITQTQAAGSVRGLRSAMQRISSGSQENPNAQRMTLREALAGYGQGLQNAMSGAAQSARGQYNTEYGIQADTAKTNYGASVDERKINFQAQENARIAQYQAQLAAYMAKMYGTGATKYGQESSRYDETSSGGNLGGFSMGMGGSRKIGVNYNSPGIESYN